jgi:hypothetical protein
LTAEDLIAALALPASCRVNRRVPKKLLLEHGAFGAGDRRAIADDVEELAWVAVCKPKARTRSLPQARMTAIASATSVQLLARDFRSRRTSRTATLISRRSTAVSGSCRAAA